MIYYGNSNFKTIINTETNKHLILNKEPFTTYSNEKINEVMGILKQHSLPYEVQHVIHYCPEPTVNRNAICLTGDGHRSYTNVVTSVNCPMCLTKMELK